MSKPILFSIIGAITGIIISQAAIHLDIRNIEIPLFAFALIVASFTLTWRKIPNKTLLIFLGSLGLILAGITLYHFWFGYNRIRKIEPLFVFALIQITVISTAFFQSWKPEKPHYTYSDLFENAWNDHFFYLFSGLLTGASLLILGLGGSLFDSIGIKVSKVIWSKEITPIIVGMLLGAGVGISREYDQLIFKFRRVFFALFRILAYLTAAIVIIFSLVLPFYLETLFANRNTSLILLSIVAVSILLLNALVDKDSNTLPSWANKIFSIQMILLPILTAVSIYAITARIGQYGLTPARIIALWVALLIGAYSLAYVIQLVLNFIRKKGSWSLGLATVNPPLAMVWVLSIILLASPILDPIKLSVNNQVSRLQNEEVSIDKFDFYALKNKLGIPGKKAIKDILTWTDHPQFALIEKKVKNAKKYEEKILSLTLLGEAPKNIDSLKRKYRKWRCHEASPCFIKQVKMNDSDKKHTVVFSFQKNGSNRHTLVSEAYEYKTRWKSLGRLNTKPFENHKMAEIIEALKKEEPKLIQPEIMDLEINGLKLRRYR